MTSPFADDPALPLTPTGLEMVETFARALDLIISLRDASTARHCLMVGDLAGETAMAMSLPHSEVRLVVLGGRLHDLGKIAIPDRILRNSDELTPRQLAVTRAHAENGERVLLELAAISPEALTLARIVGTHHERWNGAGYPRGLAGLDIPKAARLIAVADAYSAMVMKRSYQASTGHEHAIEQIRAGRGTHFDPEVVDAFLSLPFDPSDRVV